MFPLDPNEKKESVQNKQMALRNHIFNSPFGKSKKPTRNFGRRVRILTLRQRQGSPFLPTTLLFEEYEDSAKAASGDSTTSTTNEGADDDLANNTQLQYVRLSNALFVPGRKHPALKIKSNQELNPCRLSGGN